MQSLQDRPLPHCAPRSEEDFASGDPSRASTPHHIAIIMDGNRRWAKKHLLPQSAGHFEGAENLTRIVEDASDLGVKILTVYSFSTENWYRPPSEVSRLMILIEEFLDKKRQTLVEKRVKVTSIGDLTLFPSGVKLALERTVLATKDCQGLELVLAMGYGGRDEMCRAVKGIVRDVQAGLVSEDQISETLIRSYLDTRAHKDPDLLIRTAGDYRLSNFLLWQLAYTEFVITPVLWPEFTKDHLKEAIEVYQHRVRRYGK